MERNSTAVQAVVVVVMIALSGAGIVGAFGIYVAGSPDGNPRGLFLASGLSFLVAVLVPLFFFAVYPLLVCLDAKRVASLAASRSRRSAALRSLRAGAATVESDGGLVIVDALYGSVHHYRDVTGEVAARVVSDRLEMTVTNSDLGGDPSPNVAKELRIVYEYDGEQFDATFPEGAKVVLPESIV